MRQRNRAYESYRQPGSHAQSVNPACDLTVRSGSTAEGAPTAARRPTWSDIGISRTASPGATGAAADPVGGLRQPLSRGRPVGVGPTATRGRWPSSVSGRPLTSRKPGPRWRPAWSWGPAARWPFGPTITRDELLRGAALAPACRVPAAGLTAAPDAISPNRAGRTPAGPHRHPFGPIDSRTGSSLRRRWCPGVILLALLPIYEPVPGRHQILTPDSWG